MAEKTDLQEVLMNLAVHCDDVEYGSSATSNQNFALEEGVVGVFKEEEGVGLWASKDYLESHDLDYVGTFAKISILAQTSLEMVGLTAALSTALAAANIPANVIAPHYHDYIFVPFAKKNKAIKILKSLGSKNG